MTHAPTPSIARSASSRLRPLAWLILAFTPVAGAVPGSPMVEQLHPSAVQHVSQQSINDTVVLDPHGAFLMAFVHGDEMFEVDFTAVDGGGANVGDGTTTTRIPRADLDGRGAWASHLPARATGPNGSSCASCHLEPVADGAGGTAANVHRDPFHTGDVGRMIQRNTPHLHGMGAIQRLAEEMTETLHAQRDEAIAASRRKGGAPEKVALEAKGVSFGRIVVEASPGGGGGGGGSGARRDRRPSEADTEMGRMSRPKRHQGHNGPQLQGVVIDYDALEGIDEDLVVKPFQWKGTFATIREFNLDAMHNELGVQPHEILPDGVDGDGDGVHTEATVGDMTAMAIYLAAQPRPTTRVELGKYGMGPVVPPAEVGRIARGEVVFTKIGCASCHVAELEIEVPLFSEPSGNPHYRAEVFPGGQDPVALGVDPAIPVTFDLTFDQPDNMVFDDGGNLIRHVGGLESNGSGGAIVRPYGDMKRHDLGPGMAESIDEAGTGASVFLTENLWGVGVTAPYMHDGRASTLTEAILWHRGDAIATRSAFVALSTSDQQALLAFLENQVLYLPAK